MWLAISHHELCAFFIPQICHTSIFLCTSCKLGASYGFFVSRLSLDTKNSTNLGNSGKALYEERYMHQSPSTCELQGLCQMEDPHTVFVGICHLEYRLLRLEVVSIKDRRDQALHPIVNHIERLAIETTNNF